ncbi:MAG: FAD-binding oxidoreductase [Silicimonas sp.]|nr:FAD-binding oxidoreductase [Silicimonas sp.]
MLNAADTAFAERLNAAGIRTRPATPAENEEPRDLYRGQSEIVAVPATTEEAALIVRLCSEARVGLIPYGGGTGLVAGQVALNTPAPLIVSFERMTAIRAIHPNENTLVAEAGAVLADIQAAAEDANRLFPLSYGSQGSARIGGGLSVNSGGLNVLRYGTARDLCLGIEAVLPNGEILHGLKRLRKDNTGYDLRNLLIGAEGTLGLITAASLKLFPRPAHVATAFISVPDPASALDMLSLFREHAGEAISAFELISSMSFAFLAATMPQVRLPFDEAPEWCILVEIGTGPSVDAETLLAETFEVAADRGLALDARLAQSGQQRAEFWNVRESIPEANRKIGAVASHDVALPLGEIAGYIDEAREAINALLPCRINAFGHLGDGNLHYNVFPPEGQSRDALRPRAPEVTRIIHDLAIARGGTFSAEHGIGRAKVRELERYGDPARLAAMRAIKQALDPLGIMNPGAVLGNNS